jgi:hypothetical protein
MSQRRNPAIAVIGIDIGKTRRSIPFPEFPHVGKLSLRPWANHDSVGLRRDSRER